MGMQGGKVIIFDSYLIRSEMAAHCALCAIFSGIRGGGGGGWPWHLLECV